MDINKILTIVRQKNGVVKIKHDLANEANICKLLQEFGFRKSKLDNRRIYFRRQYETITLINKWEIIDTFVDFLKKDDFENVPQDVSKENILNWFYQSNPIKENGLFDHYLVDTLNEKEIHDLRMLTNFSYKHDFDNSKLLSKFNEWNFSKTIDTAGSYCKESPLYYKLIENKKYLVFNHFNANRKDLDGFDSWIATYSDEKQIGNKRPLSVQDVRLGFNLDRDFELIKQYVA
jgi:hypothetical protein